MGIQLLDGDTINKIAAGEVIERPASIVKELAENAIDAGASAVTIEIRDGGISLIRVTDNGFGIPKDEVRSAFLRHATSKIRSAGDLTGIKSLGFRGEALSSIAAVCRTEMITKTAASLIGTRFLIEGGAEVLLEEVGAPEGTTVIARDIFFHTPVRRKFLKAPATEGAHVSELAEQLAISNPQVAIRFIMNGQNRFGTSGNGSLRDILYQIYGRTIANQLIVLQASDGALKVEGLIGKPEISRGSRAMEHYCVNGRYIKSPVIAKAIEEGYGNLLMQHSFPFCALLLQVDPGQVDVNVHPTKREVRFSDGPLIYEFLKDAVSKALREKELIRDVRFPDSGGKAGKNEVSSGKNAEKALRPAEPFETGRKKAERESEKESLRSFLSEYQDRLAAAASRTREAGAGASQDVKAMQNPKNMKETGENADVARAPCMPFAQVLRDSSPDFSAHSSCPTVEKHGQYALFSPDHREQVKLVGDVFDTYWIAEWNGAVYIIDQHAAHEKVNYERFLSAYRRQEVTSQRLMPPLILTMTDREALLLTEHEALFHALGYEIEHFGGHEYTVRAVPDILPSVMKDALLKTMIGSLSEESGEELPRLIIEKTASLSCKAAVKGNQKLSKQEAETLLDEMFHLENPYNCPHGRPTVIRISKTEMERRFKRTL